MPSDVTTNDRLDGWEAISAYLGWNARTLIRWEKQKGLPVHRVPGGKRQPVYAYREEIDKWFKETGVAESITKSESAIPEPKPASETAGTQPQKRRVPRLVRYAIAAATILIGGVPALVWRLHGQRAIEITEVSQLTDDATAKENLLTNGKDLYFSEEIGGEVVLSTMSASGGPISRITVPFPNPYAEDISSDGKRLLVLSHEGSEEEHPLWVVPTANGTPYQLAGLRCGSAALSPDGSSIAFGRGNSIYIASSDGNRSRLLSVVGGTPRTLRWSTNGKRLSFFLRAVPSGSTSLWQLEIDNGFNLERAIQVHLAETNERWDELLTQGSSDYFSVAEDMARSHLLRLRREWWRSESFQEAELSTQFEAINGVAADTNSHKLFVLRGARQRGELVRYDPASQSFKMFLPGTSASYVDFTTNMGIITYVRPPNGALWVSRIDGSDAKQLSPPGMNVQLPRLSPDGKRIAFMGKLPERPFRIFVVPAAGGVPKEASSGDDNQGAPTWSPDGRFLVYGNVHCQEQHTCAIHRIELATGDIKTLPGSQGLATARWSPDGQHIAALDEVQHKLYLFDLIRPQWRKRADQINGHDVSWSSDSRFVYTNSSMSGHSEILRVSVGGSDVETILNLDTLSKSGGQLDTWFAVTPDNALLVNRWLNTSEVYALAYRE